MSTTPSPRRGNSFSRRWFYSFATAGLLLLMFIGFHQFYLDGQAYPGRPLTPPIRTLIIIHGFSMTAWMLLAMAQPLLVGAGRKHLHRKLGVLGVILAAGIVIGGVQLGIGAARATPPEMRLFGLAPAEFMAVPVVGILVFGLFVAFGMANRRRPEVHRPMMLLASVSVIGAATGRIGPLTALYAGTWLELLFSAFLMQMAFAAILLIAKCMVFRSFDRWFFGGFVALAIACVAISLGARSAAWHHIANLLLR
jgi:hypothetical protein